MYVLPGESVGAARNTRSPISGEPMIGLLQRVSAASVEVAGETVGSIDTGLLVFIGVERGDDEAVAGRLLERLLGYRMFADADGKMNRSVRDIGGGMLLVPPFDLTAGTGAGR